MPPFRLELPDKTVANRRKPKMFFTKNEYRHEVKITDWEKHCEGLPIDNDPYCPGSLNYFLAHHNSLGEAPREPLTTTTRIMLEQVHDKQAVERLYQIPDKYMVNYFTFKDTLACESNLRDQTCPELCAESYISTMQNSYTPPYPYAMQRFSFPKLPFMQNRKFRWEQDPTLSSDKFFDDTYVAQVKQIQEIKKSRSTSYDPARAINTDGSLPAERKLRCFKLDF